MGQLITRFTGGIEKQDINLDYETYAREGDADYAMDHNGEYQPLGAKIWFNEENIHLGEYEPSDYDYMEETIGDNNIQSKVLV